MSDSANSCADRAEWRREDHLYRAIQGELWPDEGAIIFAGRDIAREAAWRRALQGLARSFQITSIFPQFTALTNVVLAVQAQAGQSFRLRRAALDEPALVEPAQAALASI